MPWARSPRTRTSTRSATRTTRTRTTTRTTTSGPSSAPRRMRIAFHDYPGHAFPVQLARALAPDPAIIVADEPTGNLDETTGRDIIELLFRGHGERGTTLVVVTHDSALAARCGVPLAPRGTSGVGPIQARSADSQCFR